MTSFKYTTNTSNKVRIVFANSYEDAAVKAMFDLGYRGAIATRYTNDNIVEEIVYRVHHRTNGTTYIFIRFQ